MRRPAFVGALVGGLVVLAVLGGLRALDRTVLYWYSSTSAQKVSSVIGDEAREQFPNDMLNELRRPTSAQTYTQAGSAFAKAYNDLILFASGVKAAVYQGIDFNKPTTEQGRLADKIYALNPRDFPSEDYPFQTDDAAYQAAKNALLAKMAALPGGQQWIDGTYKNPPLILPAEMQDVEQKYRDAQRLLDAAPGQWKGLHPQAEALVHDFLKDVDAARAEMPSQGRPPLADTIHAVARQQGQPQELVNWALVLRGNDATKKRNRDPAYRQYLLDHEKEIRPFHNSLYTPAWMQ